MTALYIFAGIGIFWTACLVMVIAIVVCSMVFTPSEEHQRLAAIDSEISRNERRVAQLRIVRRHA